MIVVWWCEHVKKCWISYKINVGWSFFFRIIINVWADTCKSVKMADVTRVHYSKVCNNLYLKNVFFF